VSTRAGLRIRVECDKRAGLLADIVKVLESRGLNVEEANVGFEDRFVLDCIGSLVRTYDP
jgi:transcriptional regulator of aromatic amino acid metabolism